MKLERKKTGLNVRTGLAALIGLWGLLLQPVFGFQAASPESGGILQSARPKLETSALSRPTVRIESSLVLIPVHATTVIGAPVLNLTRSDFRLFEDGVEQTIAAFSKEETPVSVVIVFDASGSMKNKILRSSQAAAAVMKSANAEDEFCLVKLNGRPRVAVPFTNDLEFVRTEIARSKASGSTSLLDAVYLALKEMKHAHNQRKGIVIVSDGGDNWSRHSMQSIKSLLVESDAQLFAMGIYDANFWVKHLVEERNGPRMLDDLAKTTGGREYDADDLNDLPAIGERIGNALRSEYVLGYYPVNKLRDGKYRNVTLRINTPSASPQIRLHYRQGYYASSE